MKTEIGIPKMGVVITCHNEREERMVSHFLIHLDIAASIYADDGDYDAMRRRRDCMSGELAAMLWLGLMSMDDEVTAKCELTRVIKEMAMDYSREA